MQKFAFFIAWFLTLSVDAQGTVNFANGAAGVDAIVRSAGDLQAIQGPGWFAELLRITDTGEISVVGPPAPFWDGLPGYFFGGLRTITNFLEGSSIMLQVRAFNTNLDFEGFSKVIQLQPSSGIFPPPNLVGLNPWLVQPIRPLVNALVVGDKVEISWSTNYTGFSLFSSAGIAQTTWSRVAENVSVHDSRYVVPISPSQAHLFLRLAK